MDVSDVAILKASQQAEELKIDVNYKIANAASGLPFDNDSFDYVADILVSQLTLDYKKISRKVLL